MSARMTKVLGFLVAIGVVLGSLSCGSSSNNDQGTSFTALGFFAIEYDEDEGTIAVQPDTPISGIFATLSRDASNFLGLDLNTVLAGIGVQNRLSSQFIRTVRVDFEYEVPAADASLDIPNDSQPFTATLEAAGGGDGTTTGTSIAYGIIQAVSPDILSFLNINQNLLPALPFRMNVRARVVGVTQAGDTLTTNPIDIVVQFADQTECCTGTEGVSGPGTGGSADFGDTEEEAEGDSSSSAASTTRADVVAFEEPTAAQIAADALLGDR